MEGPKALDDSTANDFHLYLVCLRSKNVFWTNLWAFLLKSMTFQEKSERRRQNHFLIPSRSNVTAYSPTWGQVVQIRSKPKTFMYFCVMKKIPFPPKIISLESAEFLESKDWFLAVQYRFNRLWRKALPKPERFNRIWFFFSTQSCLNTSQFPQFTTKPTHFGE